MNKFRLLSIAEYLSLIGSVVGSAVAVASGQIIYATAPMSLSILLNLVNRYQFEQKVQQRANVTVTESYQQLSEDIQSLRASVLAMSAQVDSREVQSAIAPLSEKFDSLQTEIQSHLASLETFKSDSIHEDISQLQTQCTNLQECFDSLVYRMLADRLLSSRDPFMPEKGIEKIIQQYEEDRASRRKLYETEQ